jgi:hypothetical protein
MFIAKHLPDYMPAWKIFRVYEDADGIKWPRTLVHGIVLPDGKVRTTVLKNVYGKEIHKTPDSKGFNFFLEKEHCLEYLPRFRVNATKLVVSKIFARHPYKDPTGHYWIADTIIIPGFPHE